MSERKVETVEQAHREVIAMAAKSLEETARALRKYIDGDRISYGMVHAMLASAAMSCLNAADSMGAARSRKGGERG